MSNGFETVDKIKEGLEEILSIAEFFVDSPEIKKNRKLLKEAVKHIEQKKYDKVLTVEVDEDGDIIE